MAEQHEVLREMSNTLGSLEAKVENLRDDTQSIKKSIAELQGWKAKVTGMAAVAGGMSSFVVAWVMKHMG